MSLKLLSLRSIIANRFSIFFLIFFSLFADEEIEVSLATDTLLPPVYISAVETQDPDWRKFEEARELIAFDLKVSGSCSILPQNEALEEALFSSKKEFNLQIWKKEKIPFCVHLKGFSNKIELTLFDIEKGVSKRYKPVSIRRDSLHLLSNQIQKDLFDKEGICHCKILYTVRHPNYLKKGLDYLSEVWICDYDGQNAKQLTEENSYCLSPIASPNSSNVFFYGSEKSGQSKIYTALIDDPKGKPVVDLRGNQALACISEKGDLLAFISDVAGRPDLFIQKMGTDGKAIGKARQIFSAPRATQASPTFSPDGKYIAFVSDKDGVPRVYWMEIPNAKSTKKIMPQLITKKCRESTSPSWSKDGSKILYSGKIDGVRQIWVYDFETGEEKQLTKGDENKENPRWAPDNFHLIYNTETMDHCKLFLMNLSGQDPIEIREGRFASWQS